MGINAGSMGTVSYFGTNKPGPGVLPIRTGPIPAEAKKPFGVDPGIDWMTGKHIKLGNPEDGSEPTVALSDLSDTDLDQDGALADSDMLVYDAATAKWKGKTWPFPIVEEPGDGTDGTDGGNGTDGSDESSTTPANGDILVYNSTTSKWEYFSIPRTVLEDGAYNPVEVEYSTSTGVLRYRTRGFTVLRGFMTLGEFGAWVTIDTAEGCP